MTSADLTYVGIRYLETAMTQKQFVDVVSLVFFVVGILLIIAAVLLPIMATDLKP